MNGPQSGDGVRSAAAGWRFFEEIDIIAGETDVLGRLVSGLFRGAPRIIKSEPQYLGRRLAAVLMESSFAMLEHLHAELVD